MRNKFFFFRHDIITQKIQLLEKHSEIGGIVKYILLIIRIQEPLMPLM